NMSLGDLKTNDNDSAFRKFKLQVELVQGKHCLTNFYGMNLTKDKLCTLLKKWQSTIEAHVDVKTADGYLLRFFVSRIRRKMLEIVNRECSVELKDVVNRLIPDSIGRKIEKAAGSIFPMHDVHVRKVKVLRKPKAELGKIIELHGVKVARLDGYEPPVLKSV
uniref:40S ribosomal protein S3a n=1 Tax=Macrostomum lignano TaxID=282301 RepID=A0A1I8HZ41_9PLAT